MGKYLIIITVILFLAGCGEQGTIVGRWERYDDEAEGSIVSVEQVGSQYLGTLIKAEGILSELGFAGGDVKWRDVKQVAPYKWKGKDLIKVVDYQGVIQTTEYKDVYLTLLKNDVLEVRKFAKETEVVGTIQKWRRLK